MKKMQTQYAPIEQFETEEELRAEHDAHHMRHTEIMLHMARLLGQEQLFEDLVEQGLHNLADHVTAERMDAFAYSAFFMFTSAGDHKLMRMMLRSGKVSLTRLIVQAVFDLPEKFTAAAVMKDETIADSPAIWQQRFSPEVILDIGYLCLIDALQGCTNLTKEVHANMDAVFTLRGIMPSVEEMEAELARMDAEPGEKGKHAAVEEDELPEDLRGLIDMIRGSGHHVHVESVRLDADDL
jgi:hypothetical protein